MHKYSARMSKNANTKVSRVRECFDPLSRKYNLQTRKQMSYKCVHSKVHFYTIAALHTMEKASVEIASFPDPTKKERVG